MNKEIKFRGKRADNDEWTYGYLVFSEDYMFDYSCRIDIPYIIPINNFNLKDYREYRVDESTIGQYTGLKDKNGKEIYEGDIVRKCNVNYIVMFDPQGYWCLDGNGALNSEMLSSELPHFEVIGNIYESEVEDEKINC